MFERPHAGPYAVSLLGLVALACVPGPSDSGERIERPADRPRSQMELRLRVYEGAPGAETFELEGRSFLLDTEAVLTERDVVAVWLIEEGDDSAAIQLDFSEEGGSRLGKLTAESIGRQLAFVVDGSVVFLPTIQSRIDSSAVMGSFPIDHARQVAEGLAP